jgi:ribosome-interacting GTPase 1
MPANLPPDALKKWGEVESTHNPRDKLQRMEEFMSLVPKHKGTMKLCGQVKKQMAQIRKDLEDKKRKGVGKSGGGPKLFVVCID